MNPRWTIGDGPAPTFNDQMADQHTTVADLLNEIGTLNESYGLLRLVTPIVLLVMFLAAREARLALDPVDGKWRAKP